MCIWRTHYCSSCLYVVDIPYLCPWNKEGLVDYRYCHAQYGIGQPNKQHFEAVKARDLTHVCGDGTPYTGLWNEGDVWNEHVRVVESMKWRQSQRKGWMRWRENFEIGASVLRLRSDWWKRTKRKMGAEVVE